MPNKRGVVKTKSLPTASTGGLTGSLAPSEKSIDTNSLDRSRTVLIARLLVAAGVLGVFLTTSGLLANGGQADGPAAASAAAASEPSETERLVTVAPVEVAGGQRERRFYGVVRAAERAALSFTVGGRLAARSVDVGDPVKRGDILARLDSKPLANAVAANRASLAELDARLSLQQRERQRDAELFAAGAIADAHRDQSDSRYRSVSAARDATRVSLREAQRVLSEATLTAPFDGVVVHVNLEPGEYASPGVPVLAVSGSGRLEVEVEVPESVVRALPPGSNARVDLPLAGFKALPGRVRSLGTASAGMGLFPVLIELEDNAEVQAGMTAEVVTEVGSTQGLTVPVAAVLDPSGRRPVMMVVREGIVHRIPVRLGEMLGDRVVVRGEVDAGDSVVVGGHTFLLDGDSVRVK